MIDHEYAFRVMYHDIDQMGTMHHSEYVKYFEISSLAIILDNGIFLLFLKFLLKTAQNYTFRWAFLEKKKCYFSRRFTYYT
ncbi:MAG: hypothetical protein HC817_10340 [Saprospiraceae bacterium]|nr:hypothetical protein [Saprospiraceae bacterium]